MKIYIVVGETGAYSDMYDWYVVAYKDKEKAEKRAYFCNTDAKDWYDRRDCGYDDPPPDTYASDPHMCVDFTGTVYHVREVELV